MTITREHLQQLGHDQIAQAQAAPVLTYRQSFEAQAAEVIPGVRTVRHEQGPRKGQYVNPSLQLGWLFYQAACLTQRRRIPDQVAQLQVELAEATEELGRLRDTLNPTRSKTDDNL